MENRSPLGDRDHSPSPAKRGSIENLKRASRVKNSNMFAREQKQEYDPTSSPQIERPLATGRPLSVQVQGNAYGGKGMEGFRKENMTALKTSPLKSPAEMNGASEAASSPSKEQQSPAKSSLSNKSRYAQAQAFDPENGIWSDEEDSVAERQLPPGKSLHRHAKSVTFDAAPPQVNEYEMTTPDPSSVASESRDGSHDSAEDEDESFDRGSSIDRDDSFDASLEDTEKTPVVLPEDWRFMSPAVANEDLTARVEDPFDGSRSSPAPTARPSSVNDARASPTRTDSVDSNVDRRPLPPLPAIGMPATSNARPESRHGLAERANHTDRSAVSTPRPASITKSEIQGMGGCNMSIEDRLRLMMIQDEDKPTGPAEEQRDRRLRRGSSLKSPEPEDEHRGVEVREEEVENDELGDLGEYIMPPRISRESILRKVKARNQHAEVEEEEYSSMLLSSNLDKDELHNLDPDTPLPTTEVERVEAEVVIKQEPDDEESEVDVYSIPDLYSQHLEAEPYMNAIEKLEAVKEARAAEEQNDDDESQYSTDFGTDIPQECQPSTNAAVEDDPPTPRAGASGQTQTQLERKASNRMSLPQFAALLGEQDFGFGMESFMDSSTAVSEEPTKSALPLRESRTSSLLLKQDSTGQVQSTHTEKHLRRPVTPEEQLQPPHFPGEGRVSQEEPRTPDSVIRHPAAESPAPESPSIPEPVATIKASGSVLKTRPSATPADIQAMAEVRRQVSSEVPDVPKIPERHQSRPSVVAEADEIPLDPTASAQERETLKQPKRKSSLVPLDLPVDEADGLGIETEFDRVIEAQKVAFSFPTENSEIPPRSPGHAEYMAGQGFIPIDRSYADITTRPQKGYLMRQNTRVIVASSASHESATEANEAQDPAARGTRSAGSSPRKASHTQTWTTEPWNGKIRRKSIRQSGGSPSKKRFNEPAPPLPGQVSNVAATGLGSVNEDEAMLGAEEIGEDGERGRLFVKVVRVKDLELPLPKGKLITSSEL